MPIEIRELVIKAFVDASTDKKKYPDKKKADAPEKLIQESIDQFAEILKQEKER
jgi:hypothetical protein